MGSGKGVLNGRLKQTGEVQAREEKDDLQTKSSGEKRGFNRVLSQIPVELGRNAREARPTRKRRKRGGERNTNQNLRE